jgi:hypothetical protein
MSRLNSLLLDFDNTQKVIWPGISVAKPCLRDIILQLGGKMLETCTRLHYYIPALLKASSKDRNSSLCRPTPFVKKSCLGTSCIRFILVQGLRLLEVCLDKPFDASIIRLFNIFRKKTAGNFTIWSVIGYAFTADSPFRAGCVGAGAVYQIFFLITGSHVLISICIM